MIALSRLRRWAWLVLRASRWRVYTDFMWSSVVSKILWFLGGVMVWAAALALRIEYGEFSYAIAILYTLGAVAVVVTVNLRRDVGLFFGGAFAGNCGVGTFLRVEQARLVGNEALFLAAVGLLLGTVGAVLVCFPRRVFTTRDGNC